MRATPEVYGVPFYAGCVSDCDRALGRSHVVYLAARLLEGIAMVSSDGGEDAIVLQKLCLSVCMYVCLSVQSVCTHTNTCSGGILSLSLY